MSTEDFNNFFCLRIVLFRCRLCLPSGWCVGCVRTLHDLPSSTHITGWQMLYEAGGCVLHWTLEEIHKTQRGAAPTDLLSTGTLSLVWRVALGLAWMAGWLYKEDLLRRYSFYIVTFHIFPLLYCIFYGIKPKTPAPYWKQTQKSSKLIQVSLETEVLSDSISSFDLSPVWLFVPVSVVSDIRFASKLIFSCNSSAEIRRQTEPVQWQYAH